MMQGNENEIGKRREGTILVACNIDQEGPIAEAVSMFGDHCQTPGTSGSSNWEFTARLLCRTLSHCTDLVLIDTLSISNNKQVPLFICSVCFPFPAVTSLQLHSLHPDVSTSRSVKVSRLIIIITITPSKYGCDH
jgi:hypothetical protein